MYSVRVFLRSLQVGQLDFFSMTASSLGPDCSLPCVFRNLNFFLLVSVETRLEVSPVAEEMKHPE
jgi:hypothetical protein